MRIKVLSLSVLKFEVEDTGIGIKQEDLTYLIAPSKRASTSNQRYLNPQGVGLGLEISNELAKMLRPQAIPLDDDIPLDPD